MWSYLPCYYVILAVYMYLESTGLQPHFRARLVSPRLPPRDTFRKCLRFNYNMLGRHIGKLAILDANGYELWHFDGKGTCKKELS